MARAALLKLMRSDGTLFEGADPDRLEKLSFKRTGSHVFQWGAFEIDVETRTYSAVVDMGYCTRFVDGEFDVAPSGRWKAQRPTMGYALERVTE
jgi:hypothetical protein